MKQGVPSLYEWAGGMPALERLTTRFYERIASDAILAPVFAEMDRHHPHFVAQFLAEVLGGPKGYSAARGGHPRMVSRHLARHLTQPQRGHWLQLLLDTADEVGLPRRSRVPLGVRVLSGVGVAACGHQLSRARRSIPRRRCRTGAGERSEVPTRSKDEGRPVSCLVTHSPPTRPSRCWLAK